MSRSGCFLAEEEYVQDILSWVKSRERRQPVSRSPQLYRSNLPGLPCPVQDYHSRRRQLIEWTCGISSRLGLTTQTVHLAVRWEHHVIIFITF